MDTRQKRGAKPLYDFASWFRLKRFVLKRGVHYRCSHSTMSAQIRNAASKLGLRVSVDEVEGADGTFLLVAVNPAKDLDLFGEAVARN